MRRPCSHPNLLPMAAGLAHVGPAYKALHCPPWAPTADLCHFHGHSFQHPLCLDFPCMAWKILTPK